MVSVTSTMACLGQGQNVIVQLPASSSDTCKGDLGFRRALWTIERENLVSGLHEYNTRCRRDSVYNKGKKATELNHADGRTTACFS